MVEAAMEAVQENAGSTDGSWQKRGLTSLSGVVTATSIDNSIINLRVSRQFKLATLVEESAAHERDKLQNAITFLLPLPYDELTSVLNYKSVVGLTAITPRALKQSVSDSEKEQEQGQEQEQEKMLKRYWTL
ncbi:uncharacterized protein [Periplaneta americana]|uniref:uncharacterized protein isoform X2 n=1 Tax=Periplaneta americana TaxID=6978 RepID=UPI0037E880F5